MRRAPLVALAVLLTAAAATSRAQISPGELSRAHAALDGSTQCLSCHERGRGVAADKCLSCHTALAARVQAGAGLHAQPGHQECGRCHVEHHGRDFDLVFWGKAGRDAFDHRQTGHPLEGAHARLRCNQCHQPRRIADPARLAQGGANPHRTLLGLSRECRSCHDDVHRGRFAPAACTACHTQSAWRPAPGFDHDRTAFPLTGAHDGVACDRCHKVEAATNRPRFRGTAFQTCTACHRDPHPRPLGPSCTACHTTQSWSAARGTFDHSRTGYPLLGRHAEVKCAQCHAAGRPRRLARAACTDCHPDHHLGQLSRRADGGRCDSCHDVNGFERPRFTAADHEKTAFPLSGAHRAVACNECHRKVPVERLRALGAVTAARGGETEQLRFPSASCATCHADPHGGTTARVRADCRTCHGTADWRRVSFDHAATGFALRGAHAAAACARCHAREGAPRTVRASLRFTGAPKACTACHKDPHEGRFARGGATDCARCHEPTRWAHVRFDHDRETRFPLGGAHARVACARCHRDAAGGARYRGLPLTCAGCHQATP